jgi:type II secretory pathway pseudopilin PulG
MKVRGLCFLDASGQRGFTQLEAAIVLAATLLIGALLVAAVRTYLVRAEIEESIALAKYAQDQVTRAFRRTGTPPADSTSAGLSDDHVDSATRYLAETRVADGRIDLVFGPEASAALAGRTLSLTPFETADQKVVWVCGSKEPGVGLKPLGFAGGGPLALQAPTTIDAHYLPPACR